MKRKLLTLLFCFGALFTTNLNSNAQSILVHYFNFNTFTGTMYTPTITPVSSDYSRTTPSASVLYTVLAGDGTYGNWNSYFDYKTAVPADYDTVNQRFSTIDGNWVRCRNPSDSMQFMFYMSTKGYTNLTIKYGTEASSINGPSIQNYSYSLDSGSTWITTGGLSTQMFIMDTVNLSTDTFRLASVHVTDPAASNNPKFVFRITFQYHNVGGSGNDRFDNITLDADTDVLNPALGVVTKVIEQPFTISPNPVANILNVSSAMDGDKSIIIYNALAERVYTASGSSRQMSINTADLSAGVYFISIRESSTGNTSVMKFIKQ